MHNFQILQWPFDLQTEWYQFQGNMPSQADVLIYVKTHINYKKQTKQNAEGNS